MAFLCNALTGEDLKFDGVVVSECLEMEALSQTIGVGGGTVMVSRFPTYCSMPFGG